MLDNRDNLPSSIEKRNGLIHDFCSHAIDPELTWLDFGEYDSDWETAATALGVELPKSGRIEDYRAILRPLYWRSKANGFMPL